MRTHLESLERQTRRRPAELDGIPCPPAIAYLLGWFGELASRRTGSGFGPNPITFSEMLAWASLTGRSPLPFEVFALGRLDDAFLRVVNEKSDG